VEEEEEEEEKEKVETVLEVVAAKEPVDGERRSLLDGVCPLPLRSRLPSPPSPPLSPPPPPPPSLTSEKEGEEE
jgi:hypothetical protein